jgi:hypothetical protein
VRHQWPNATGRILAGAGTDRAASTARTLPFYDLIEEIGEARSSSTVLLARRPAISGCSGGKTIVGPETRPPSSFQRRCCVARQEPMTVSTRITPRRQPSDHRIRSRPVGVRRSRGSQVPTLDGAWGYGSTRPSDTGNTGRCGSRPRRPVSEWCPVDRAATSFRRVPCVQAHSDPLSPRLGLRRASRSSS